VYDDAMLRNLAPLGVSSLLGKRFALIRLSLTSLQNPLLQAFSNQNTVVMITPGDIAESELAGVRSGLQHLEKIGICHGWTIDRPRPELAEFLHNADLIEIESTALDGIQLKTMSLEFRSHQSKQKLIASELQTSDDFNLCYHCGFDYFMGPFITSRENWHAAKSEINRLRFFEALNMIRSGAEFDAIADCLCTDPILTFKLLRYINSPGIGLPAVYHRIIFPAGCDAGQAAARGAATGHPAGSGCGCAERRARRNALLLGMAVESAVPDEIAAAAAQCGLDATQVTGIMIEALAWSQQIISAGEQR
jgi:hypothetical protein